MIFKVKILIFSRVPLDQLSPHEAKGSDVWGGVIEK